MRCWGQARLVEHRSTGIRRRLGTRRTVVRPTLRVPDKCSIRSPALAIWPRGPAVSPWPPARCFPCANRSTWPRPRRASTGCPADAWCWPRLRRPAGGVPRLRVGACAARRAVRPGPGLPAPTAARLPARRLAARYAGRRRTVAASAGRRHPAGRHRLRAASGLAGTPGGWLADLSGVDCRCVRPRRLAGKIRAWRMSIADGGFRPHMTNEWLDLVDDPAYPRTPLHGGYVLRTGRRLDRLLGEWRAAGVNHAALGIQFSARPARKSSRNWPRRCCRCSRPTRACSRRAWTGS